MLVLSRKPGERILIAGTTIEVTVIAVHGNRVQVGIEAPRAISIVRGELIDARNDRTKEPIL